ncbi:MAG: Uma2 family endonuclease, partial [Leptolyngbyaceae cyanobacterium T60_A2020_046]|nr:Uma2 family endonuclease [Leptolyngbyaceae cyanobacterium T60_A2020_046]
FQFYETYGVEEYYIYDPDTFDLRGWQRQGDYLMRIPQMHGYRSPRLGIQFQTDSGELQIYRPDGRRFLTPVELNEQFEQERQRAEQERQRAEQERQRAERMAAYLRSLGVDPDNLPLT